MMHSQGTVHSTDPRAQLIHKLPPPDQCLLGLAQVLCQLRSLCPLLGQLGLHHRQTARETCAPGALYIRCLVADRALQSLQCQPLCITDCQFA